MRKIINLLFLVLIFLLTSCFENKPELQINDSELNDTKTKVYIYINDSFSAEQINYIHKSINIWNKTTNGYLLVIKNNSNNFIPMIIDNVCNNQIDIAPDLSSSEQVKALDAINKRDTIGYTHYNECGLSTIKLVVDRIDDNNKLLWVSLHEIGHAIGLKRIKNDNSVMNPIYLNKNNICYNGSCCLAKYEMEQFCEKYHCDVEKTKYCF